MSRAFLSRCDVRFAGKRSKALRCKAQPSVGWPTYFLAAFFLAVFLATFFLATFFATFFCATFFLATVCPPNVESSGLLAERRAGAVVR